MTLSGSFMLALGINMIMFIPAYFLQTDKLTDISYSITFIIISLASFLYSKISLSSWLLLIMLLLWSLRLGIYLLYRIRKIGHDRRFNIMRKNFLKFLMFWVLQGFTVWIVMLPSILFFQAPEHHLSWLSGLGFLMWGSGLIIETIADQQKSRFYDNPNNRGTWLDSGLWHYSRHPNYFGEILIWLGVYVYTLNSLNGSHMLYAAISPLFISIMLIFISGIPLLEKSADAKFGQDPNYQRYKKNTSCLIPWAKKQKNISSSPHS